MKILKNIAWMAALVFVGACEVSDDIPYPIVYGQITEFEVEGQCNADGGTDYSTVINRDNREVTLYVCDTVNLANLRITRLGASGTTYNPDVDYTDAPVVLPDSTVCDDFSRFPKNGFKEPAKGQNTSVDFRKPVKFTVHTYQNYEWTVTVKQVVKREIELENQIGNAVIDDFQRNVIVYVSRAQNLRKIKVNKFTLGGEHGTVLPDPTREETYDFYNLRQFVVQTGWGEIQIWNVIVYQTNAVVETTAKAFPRNTSMTISGNKPNGITPEVEYRSTNESTWHTVPEADMNLTATTYSVTINGLKPATKYIYKVKAGNSSVSEQETTTIAMQQLPNTSFDDWSTDANISKLLCPWAAGETSYWDTGNRGATTVGNSNSVPTDDTSTGRGKAAYLESKWIVIKFAAGNIFTGKYLKTDGTNGILGFGRPFTAFPTKMSFDYKYATSEISRIGDEKFRYLTGRPDSCQIYIALWHLEDGQEEVYQGESYPIVIRTKPGSEQHLFSPDDSRVIAYGQLTQGDNVPTWTSETITLNYKRTDVAPTHIQVVASSSKYGDYFTGGVGSALTLDNIKLIYE